jgi:hypothetical protein
MDRHGRDIGRRGVRGTVDMGFAQAPDTGVRISGGD